VKAEALLRHLLAQARKLRTTKPKIDYFATSLPVLLLLEEDLQFRQGTTARFLEAQAQLGPGRSARVQRRFQLVLQRDPNPDPATDLARGSGSGQRE